MTLLDICKAAGHHCLELTACLHPAANDCLPENTHSLLLFNPQEPAFWPYFQNSVEARDGRVNPLDRWSKRILTDVAKTCKGTAIFPSDGPPHPPFIAWALASKPIWHSPVGLLVNNTAGLLLSFRGAIAVPDTLPLSALQACPCETCDTRPCLTACPVGAINTNGYDLARCHSHLETVAGQSCMSQGCALRQACPISQSYGRLPAQSAFHMRAFHTL